ASDQGTTRAGDAQAGRSAPRDDETTARGRSRRAIVDGEGFDGLTAGVEQAFVGDWVRDGGESIREIGDRPVRPRAAVDGHVLDAVASVDRVVARAAGEMVDTRPAVEPVVASGPFERVVTFAAVQAVVAFAPYERVVAR